MFKSFSNSILRINPALTYFRPAPLPQLTRKMSTHITKVAIVGATGRIGRSFATELLATGKHEVTALVRPDTNKDKLPKGLKTAAIDYEDDQSIVEALKGQEFLAITLGVFAPQDLHSRIVKAAAEAGVKCRSSILLLPSRNTMPTHNHHKKFYKDELVNVDS